jgi:hypothetical protein
MIDSAGKALVVNTSVAATEAPRNVLNLNARTKHPPSIREIYRKPQYGRADFLVRVTCPGRRRIEKFCISAAAA